MKRWLIFVLIIFLAGCAETTDLVSQAQRAEYEARAAEQRAESARAAMTATAGAPILRVTEQAAILELERQRSAMTASAVQSTMEASWTPTPNVTATYEMAIVIAQQTAIRAESERNLLELERQRNSNYFKSVAPGLTFLFVGVIVIWLVTTISRRERMRVIPRDARGDAPLLMDSVDGIVTDLDVSPNFQASTRPQRKDNPLPQLPAVTPERQDRVKQADQMIELGTRGLPGPVNSRTEERRQIAVEEAMKQLPAGTDKFKVLGPGDTPPASVVDPDTIEILDAQWKEVEE